MNVENELFAKSLCEEAKTRQKERSELLDRNRISINTNDVVVRSNVFYCGAHHEYTELAGEVEICDKKGNIIKCLIPITYCKDCNILYTLESSYEQLKKKGVILCQILKYKEYKKFGGYSPNNIYWREHSPLWFMGYNVNKEDDLSDQQRQVILSRILDLNILSRNQILSYLNLFIKNHANYSEAVDKWEMDREFVGQYKVGTIPRVYIDKLIIIDT